MRILCSRSFLVAAAVATVGNRPVAAQARPPQLHATVELRIDKALPPTSRSSGLLIGPAGEMIVAQTQSTGAIHGFSSTGQPLAWSIPVGIGRDTEIRWVARMGWAGSTLWVADPGFGQLALIDRNGKITKSLEYPSWIRPAWADRRKFPVFAGVEPLALYADGSWLVRPSRERSVLSTPEYDNSYSYAMRIAENGAVQNVVAKLPRDERRFFDPRMGNVAAFMPNTLVPLTLWDVSTDGARIVVVATSLSGADSATYRVSTLGPKGDTIYSRKFPFVPAALSPASLDSVRSRVNRGNGRASGDDNRAGPPKQTRWAYTPIENLVVGRDQSTWIGLRPTLGERLWIALDASGAPIGTLSLPKDFVLRAAERERVWGFGPEGELVRYKLSPAGGPVRR
jgi:hypothetical protein